MANNNNFIPKDPISGAPSNNPFADYSGIPGFSGFGGMGMLPNFPRTVMSEVSGVLPLDPMIQAVMTPITVNKVLVVPLYWPMYFNMNNGKLRNLARFIFCDMVSAVSGFPSYSLNTQEIRFGAVEKIVVPGGGITKNADGIEITTKEFKNMPTTKLCRTWVGGIRDPTTGFFHGHGQISEQLLALAHPLIYSAGFMYIATGPSGSVYDIARAVLLMNAFPSEVPNVIENASNVEEFSEIPQLSIKMNGTVLENPSVYMMAKLILAASFLRCDEYMVPLGKGFYDIFKMTKQEQVDKFGQNLMTNLKGVYGDDVMAAHKEVIKQTLSEKDAHLNPSDYGFPIPGKAFTEQQ